MYVCVYDFQTADHPKNWIRLSNAVSMLVHRLRHRPNIETAFGGCLVFGGVYMCVCVCVGGGGGEVGITQYRARTT